MQGGNSSFAAAPQRRFLSRWCAARLACCAAAALALILGACSKNVGGRGAGKRADKATSSTLELAKQGAEKREFTVPVRAEAVKRREVRAYVQTIGSIAPIQATPVLAETAGRLLFVKRWQPDDEVKQGQEIARIDERDVENDVKAAEVDLETAQSAVLLDQARLQKSEEDLRTVVDLVSRELRPRRELDDAKIQVKTAQTQLDHSKNQLRKAELALQTARKKREGLTLRAPIDGVLCPRADLDKAAGKNYIVQNRDVTELDQRLIGPGEIVCGVLDLTRVIARCDVTAKDIPQVRVGSKALALIDLGSETLQLDGAVLEISSGVNPDTRAFTVDVILRNRRAHLRPGMFARVNIVTAVRRDAIAIPRKALQKRNNEDVVFVVDEQNYAVARPVVLGIENPEEVEVVQGLREGDRLVTMGQETLQDRVKVDVMASDDASAPSAASVPASKAATASAPSSR